MSPAGVLNTGAPQRCVLSPLLFPLYTNNCTSNSAAVKLLKFADDTTVIGLRRDRQESIYRSEVERMVQWCGDNNLILSVTKTKELIFDFRKKAGQHLPISINGQVVEWVRSFPLLRQLYPSVPIMEPEHQSQNPKIPSETTLPLPAEEICRQSSRYN